MLVGVGLALLGSRFYGSEPPTYGGRDGAPLVLGGDRPAGLEPLPDDPRVLIFGDSYTAAEGAEASAGYAQRIGDLMGWSDVRVDGMGWSGFLNAGEDGRSSFLDRLKALDAGDDFDLVIVQGGSDDEDVPGDRTLARSVGKFVRLAERQFPSAQLVLLTPVSLDTAASDDIRRITDTLIGYGVKHGVPVISPSREIWFSTSDREALVNDAVDRPNAAGYDQMARRLAERLSALLDPDVAEDTEATAVG